MNKTVQDYATDPFAVMQNAIMLFDSKQQNTLIVEGLCDKRFYKQFGNTALNIKHVEGKPNVLKAYNFWFSRCREKLFAHFIVDVDRDFLLNGHLDSKINFNYHVWGKELLEGYNDLECFLVKTSAFRKVVVNYDIDLDANNRYLENILDATSYVGAFRLADEIVQKEHFLHDSVLDGVSLLEEWFSDDMVIQKQRFDDYVERRNGKNKHCTEMIDLAHEKYASKDSDIQLCRGHDITEAISFFVGKKSHRRTPENPFWCPKPEEIEEKLRLACERAYLERTPFTSFTFWKLLNNCQENV